MLRDLPCADGPGLASQAEEGLGKYMYNDLVYQHEVCGGTAHVQICGYVLACI